MTPQEFRAWRDRLNLTQQAAADALGTTKRAVQMWEAGDRPILRTVQLATRCLEEHPEEVRPGFVRE